MATEGFWTIGGVVGKLRTEQGITVRQLSRGICSVVTLSRIEMNKRDMDMMMAEMIFERLGYTPDKYEIYTGPEELERYQQREEILQLAEKDEFQKLEEAVEQYETQNREKLTCLEQQFVKGIKGFAKWKLGDVETAEILVEQALNVTVPPENGAWVVQAVLSEKELNLLWLLSEIYREQGKKADAFHLVYQIFQYFEQSEERKKQVTNIYVQIVIRLTEFLLNDGETKRAYEACLKAVLMLRTEKKLSGLAEIIEWKGICEEKLEKEEKIATGTSRGSYMRAYYLYLTLDRPEEADRVKAHLEELGQWESIWKEK